MPVMVALVAAFAIFTSCVPRFAEAVPAYPGPIRLSQPDGTPITVLRASFFFFFFFF